MTEVEVGYINNLLKLKDASSQCEYLMMLGFQKQPKEQLKIDRYRIGGCKTAIWIKVEKKGDRIELACDSDSILVRGVLVIFEELYQGKMPLEAKKFPPKFLAYVSDDVIYPEIKQNGLLKCYERVAALSE